MKELGWKPTTMFKDVIKLTIDWYKKHMDWMNECTSGDYLDYYKKCMIIDNMIKGSNEPFLYYLV